MITCWRIRQRIMTIAHGIRVMSQAVIAGKLIARMKRQSRGKLANIRDIVAGRVAAEQLQKTARRVHDAVYSLAAGAIGVDGVLEPRSTPGVAAGTHRGL
jgi:hypothetical protein